MARILRSPAELDIGVHLAITSEWPAAKWGPLTALTTGLGAQSRPEPLGQASITWLYYRDVPVAMRFYEDVLGMPVVREGDDFVELDLGPGTMV